MRFGCFAYLFNLLLISILATAIPFRHIGVLQSSSTTNQFSFAMKKGFLILIVCFVSCIAFAQSPAQKDPENQKPVEKQEQSPTPKQELPSPAKEEVKAVPSAKGSAKPERVVATKPGAAKPAVTRPARNPRPAARPVRPGRGR